MSIACTFMARQHMLGQQQTCQSHSIAPAPDAEARWQCHIKPSHANLAFARPVAPGPHLFFRQQCMAQHRHDDWAFACSAADPAVSFSNMCNRLSNAGMHGPVRAPHRGAAPLTEALYASKVSSGGLWKKIGAGEKDGDQLGDCVVPKLALC